MSNAELIEVIKTLADSIVKEAADAIAAADKRIAELTELAEKMSIAAMEERHRRIKVYGDLKVAREAMSKAASLECNGVIRVALAQIGGDDAGN